MSHSHIAWITQMSNLEIECKTQNRWNCARYIGSKPIYRRFWVKMLHRFGYAKSLRLGVVNAIFALYSEYIGIFRTLVMNDQNYYIHIHGDWERLSNPNLSLALYYSLSPVCTFCVRATLLDLILSTEVPNPCIPSSTSSSILNPSQLLFSISNMRWN